MARRHSTIDPFNADEPVMPGADGAEELGEVGGHTGYDAPRKARDFYEAPRDNAAFHAERETRAQRPGAPASTEGQQAEDPEDQRSPITSGEAEERSRSRQGERPPVEGMGAYQPEELRKPRWFERPARQRSVDLDGVSKGLRRARSSIGFLFTAFQMLLLPLLLFGMWFGGFEIIADLMGSGSSSITSAGPKILWSDDDDDEADARASEAHDQQQVEAAVASFFEELPGDQAFLDDRLVQFDDRARIFLGYTTEELGLSADDFLAWQLDGFTHEVSYVDWRDGAQAEGASAGVYVSTSAHSELNMFTSFQSKAEAYLKDQFGSSYNVLFKKIPQLTDEQKATIQTMFIETLAEDLEPWGWYGRLQFERQDGVWVLDQEDARDHLDSIFL